MENYRKKPLTILFYCCALNFLKNISNYFNAGFIFFTFELSMLLFTKFVLSKFQNDILNHITEPEKIIKHQAMFFKERLFKKHEMHKSQHHQNMLNLRNIFALTAIICIPISNVLDGIIFITTSLSNLYFHFLSANNSTSQDNVQNHVNKTLLMSFLLNIILLGLIFNAVSRLTHTIDKHSDEKNIL